MCGLGKPRSYMAGDFGQACRKQHNAEMNSSGLSRNPKLDSARKLRGIYFIDPDVKEKSKHACIEEPHGSTFFTRFTILDEKPPERYTWFGRLLTKKHTTSRLDYLWPERWKNVRSSANEKKKQKKANEKPKLENVGRLRGIYFIDPADEGLKETLSKTLRKLEVPMPAAMLCKIRRGKYRETCRTPDAPKTKYACIVEADESTRKHLERTLPRDHEDRIAGKGWNSLNHHNLAHNIIPMSQAMKILDAKAAVGNEWEKLETIPAWQLTKVRNKKDVIDETRQEGKTVHLASLMDICHLMNSELEPKFQKCKGRVALRGDTVKDDSGSCAVFTARFDCIWNDDRKSNGCHSKATTFCRTSSRRSISLHRGQRWQDAPPLLEVPKSEWPVWIRLPRHKWPKSWSNMEDLVVLLERNLHGQPPPDWESQFEQILLGLGWEQAPNWECLFVHRKQGLCSSVYVDATKMAGRKHNLNPMWKKLMKLVDLGELRSFRDHVYLGCTQRECKWNESIIDENRKVFESRIAAGATEKPPGWENPHANTIAWFHEWKDIRSNEWNDIASWQTKRLSNCFRSLHLVLTATNSEKKWKRWENEQKSALKSWWSACIWRSLADTIEGAKKMFKPQVTAGATQKLPGWEKSHAKTVAWSNDMEGGVKKCLKKLANWQKKKAEQLYKVSAPCLDQNFKKEELDTVGKLSTVCSQIVLECLSWARIGRPDILWSVNKLARAVTKWTWACDKRLARLISYSSHMWIQTILSCGNTAKQCRLGLFQDSDFVGDLEDSKSTSGGIVCIFGSRQTFVPVSWMCKKQTSVSHSSTEVELISLDAGLRTVGIW